MGKKVDEGEGGETPILWRVVGGEEILHWCGVLSFRGSLGLICAMLIPE
jgi:hypothetical protein